jgi:hypothetical protein
MIQGLAQSTASFSGLFVLGAIDAPAGTSGKRDEYRDESLPGIKRFRMAETGDKHGFPFWLSKEKNSVLAKK